MCGRGAAFLFVCLSVQLPHLDAPRASLTDRLTNELKRFKMVCAYCATPLNDSSVNSDCAVNTPANATARIAVDVGADDGPQASRGSRRHYFVQVGTA